ncbi:MAG TPA: DUF4394 domain-containing protein [Solimonas sp.]|nr:DUF4394 domain-containing protein [Solimonas sp.]
MAFRKPTALLVACIAVLTLSACGSGGDDAPGPTARLTVTKAGTGSGTVTSSPAGINCGTTCAADFPVGTAVTLTAAPALNNTFTGWSGPGAGSCGTSLTCSGPVSSNVSITATFQPGSTLPLPAGVIGLTATNKLISFNRASPDSPPVSSQTVTGLQTGEFIQGIDFRPSDGLLYGMSNQSRVYKLDARTGGASAPVVMTSGTPAVPVLLNGTDFGVDFNPTNNLMRVVSNTGQNLAIDVTTGATTVQSALNGAGTGATAAAYNSNTAGATGTVLFVIDTAGASDALYVQNPPGSGTLTRIGPLTVDASGVNGFEISGSQDALAALTVAGSPRLFSINLASGVATTIATINTGEPAGTAVRGLAVKPTGVASQAGDAFVLFRGNQLASFNRSTPQTLLTQVPVIGLQGGDNLIGVDFHPATGVLYGVGRNGNLYTISTASGLASLAFPLTAAPGSSFAGLGGSDFGIGFDAVSNVLRVVSNGRQNLRINTADGTVIADPALNRRAQPSPSPDVSATATAVATTNEFAGALSRTIFLIDTQNDVLAQMTNGFLGQVPGFLSNVGSLGIAADDANGFDIDGVNGVALAALRTSSDGLNRLYQIGLTSGAADSRGLIGNGTQDVIGLSLRAPLVPVVYGVTTDNKLVSFGSKTPDVLLSGPTAITGLGAAEQVVGIDFRPSDGALIGVTSNGKVYQINPATAAATLGQIMVRGTPDDPFAALVGPEFGIDFNPMGGTGAAGLRVLSEASENLAVNPTNGQVFTDPDLNETPSVPPTQCDMAAGGPSVGATAYDNNFVGTLGTTLYALESSSGCLFTVDPPSGEMTPVGVLFSDPSASITSIAGFDIVGGHNGLTLAALQTGTGEQSHLYNVDLGGGLTGIGDGVEDVGAIGPAGTAAIRGIAIRLPPTNN